jgi:hypothetical protein
VSIAVRRQDDCFWQSMWNLLRVYNVGAWQVILGVFFIILVCGWLVSFLLSDC